MLHREVLGGHIFYLQHRRPLEADDSRGESKGANEVDAVEEVVLAEHEVELSKILGDVEQHRHREENQHKNSHKTLICPCSEVKCLCIVLQYFSSSANLESKEKRRVTTDF